MTIQFVFGGDYTPTVKFFKSKREIKPNNRYVFNLNESTKKGTISFSKLKFQDEGKYSIQLINKDGKPSDEANLNIFVKGTCIVYCHMLLHPCVLLLVPPLDSVL